jgi:cytochrome b561
MPTVQLFGAWPLPKIASVPPDMMRSMPRIHATLTWLLLGLVGLHVAAAIYGTLVAGERTIFRMLPWPRRDHGT